MNNGKRKTLSLQNKSSKTQTSLSTFFFPKVPACKTGPEQRPEPPKPTAAVRPQPDIKLKTVPERNVADDDIWDDDIYVDPGKYNSNSKAIPRKDTKYVKYSPSPTKQSDRATLFGPKKAAEKTNFAPKPTASTSAVNSSGARKTAATKNPFLSSSDDEDSNPHNFIEEVISDDSPTKSPVIERRGSQAFSQVRKPLFQPCQSTLTQLPAHREKPKPVQPKFCFDAQTIEEDSNDIFWEDAPFKTKTKQSAAAKTSFQPKTGFMPLQSSARTSLNASTSSSSISTYKAPQTNPVPLSSLKTSSATLSNASANKNNGFFDFDTNFLLPDDDFEVVPKKASPAKSNSSITILSQSPLSIPEPPSKIEKFEKDVLEWTKGVDALKAITLSDSNLTSDFLVDIKKQAKGLWQKFNDLCITMLSLNLREVKSETAIKMRTTALLIRAKLLLLKKKLANFPKENMIPKANFPSGEEAANFVTPLRENLQNRELPSTSSSGYSSYASDAASSFLGSFPDNSDFQDRPPALQPSARPSEEVNYMSAIYHKQSPANQKSKLALNQDKDKFHGKFKNDAEDPKFQGYNFPHSEQMRRILRNKFGLVSFRPNQLQAINAAILKCNCFVLMPTGGGKSLCYQLPALVTGGVTIVVSPLKSLILDQVNKLNTLGITSAHLSGEMSYANQIAVYDKMELSVPGITLLYVTPEKLSASNRLVETLRRLYNRNLLSRFVIDEAHCVSQWGHDFRPDYKKLSALRENFPGVPTMALTATATPVVRTDILHQLRMNDPKWFLSSFNRPNLQYSVIKKMPQSINQLLELLNSSKCKNKSGIIYCFSRKDCDKMADNLQQKNIQAGSYHAGLSDKTRADVQHSWTIGTIKVMCATIAFGMGIDKPDVRYVIHHSVSQSIEGYYQEAGRAGRDGEIAHCILMYSYADVRKIIRLIESDPINPEVIKTRKDNLFRMSAFCDNKVDCRRSLQLKYFGENFSREECLKDKKTACDNCLGKGDYCDVDCLQLAKDVVNCVKSICGFPGGHARFTQLHFIDILKGSKNSRIINLGHDKLPIHGKAEGWDRTDVERIMHKLLADNFLYEEFMITREDMSAAYLRVGPECHRVFSLDKYKFTVKRPKNGTGSAHGTPIMQKKLSADEELMLDIQANCLKALQEKIREIAMSLGVSPATVANQQALMEMSKRLPETREQMLKIPHVTESNYHVFGAQLLMITQTFSQNQQEALASFAADFYESDDETEELMSINAPNGPPSNARSSRGRGGFRGKSQKFHRKRKFKGNGGGPSTKRSKAGGRGARTSRGGGGGTSRGPSGETLTTRPSVNRGIQNMPVPMGRGNIRNLKISMS